MQTRGEGIGIVLAGLNRALYEKLRRGVNEILMKMKNDSQTMSNLKFEPTTDSGGETQVAARASLESSWECRLDVIGEDV